MKIKLDRGKYRKRLVALTTMAVLFGIGSVLALVINLLNISKLSPERVVAVVGLLIFCSFFGYLAKLYYPVRKLEYAMTYENGLLNDYSKPFNKAVDLKIEDIDSISFWSGNKGVNQYKIVTKNHDPRRSALMNQLKGNDLYLSDYVVDSNDLEELIQLIESERVMRLTE